jgi:hypothetical protein
MKTFCGAKAVAFISPRKSNRVNLGNSIVQKMMPPWSWDETLKCWNLVYKRYLPEDSVVDAFLEGGGSARYIFEDRPYREAFSGKGSGFRPIKAQLTKVDLDTIISYQGNIRESVEMDLGYYRILHPFPDDEYFQLDSAVVNFALRN